MQARVARTLFKPGVLCLTCFFLHFLRRWLFMAERHPSDIARETLKQLALRRLAPTPDNFRTLYDEISGSSTPPPFPEGATLFEPPNLIHGMSKCIKDRGSGPDQPDQSNASHWSARFNDLIDILTK